MEKARMIKTMEYSTFKNKFLNLIRSRGESQFEGLRESVQAILADIKQNGDNAIIKFEEQFDNVQLSKNQIKVTNEEIKSAYSQVDSQIIDALKQIIKNISAFHEAQKRDLWYIETRKGVSVGQIMRPIERIGVYIPGGKAPYPSTVLMTTVPAKIAGVKEIILCTPPRADGTVNPVILIAAQEAGTTAIYKVGGVQAIGAMAYGTETIPPVNKIVGPGNKYVNTAKLLVSTSVGIDLPAGPSEVLIFADDASNATLIAIDLIAQAEHDENVFCFLVTLSKTLADQVEKELKRLILNQPRKQIIEQALKENGFIITVSTIEQGIELINEIAPEHLELQIEDAETLLPQILNAGAIFLGKNSPVPVGDYAAGSNHVLPTGGSSKIYSGLSIFSFMKLIDVIKCSTEGIQTLLPWIEAIAQVEGLNAHIQAVQMRVKK